MNYQDTTHSKKGFGINGGNPLESFSEDLRILMDLYNFEICENMDGKKVITPKSSHNSNDGIEIEELFLK